MKYYLYLLHLQKKEVYSHTLIEKYLEKKHHDLHGCVIKKNNDGAPALMQGNQVYPLSISHKNNYVCIAFSKDNVRLGVDIEEITSKNLLLSKEYCQKEEILDIESSKNKERLATIYWTIKEATGKAFGEGLTFHPRKIFLNRKKKVLLKNTAITPAFVRIFTKENYIVSFVAILKN